MPNIKTYNAPLQGVSALRPNETGINASEQTARTIGRLAAQENDQLASVGRGQERAAGAAATAMRDVARGVGDVAEAVGYQVAKHQEQQEITKQAADKAQVLNTAISGWNEVSANANLNDPGVAQKYNEETLAPLLNDFQNNYHTPRGREAAQQFVDRIYEHMGTIQRADASTRAGEAAVQNFHTFTNENADTLVKHPASLDLVNEITRDQIEKLKSNPLLTEGHRVQLDEGLRKALKDNTFAAFQGMTLTNPAAAKVALAEGFGKDELTAEERITLNSHADAMSNALNAKQRADEAEVRRKNEDAVKGTVADLYSKAFQPDGSFTPNGDFFSGLIKAAQMPRADPSLLKSAFELGDAKLRQPPIVNSDPDLLQHFNERSLLPPGNKDALTYQQIMDAQARQLLSDRDAGRLMKNVTEMPKDPQRLEAYKQFQSLLGDYKNVIARVKTMNGTMIGPVPLDQQVKWGQFQTDMRQQFDSAYASGKWRGMLDKNSSDYIGQKALDYVSASDKGALKGVLAPKPVTSPAAQPAKPDDTPESYLGIK